MDLPTYTDEYLFNNLSIKYCDFFFLVSANFML